MTYLAGLAMAKTTMAGILTVGLLSLSSIGSHPASAQDGDALQDYQAMTPETARTLAEATLESCRAAGYQITVTVVDRSGIPQVMIRDRFAGVHTIETSRRKAWTAVSFKTDTLSFAELTQPGTELSGIRMMSDVAAIGGGIPVLAAGSLVGGVGVSGAPGGALDHKCAQDGIDAIAADLEF